jgi:uncharacterized protein with von Willebrand factor type A (vWA) domain
MADSPRAGATPQLRHIVAALVVTRPDRAREFGQAFETTSH